LSRAGCLGSLSAAACLAALALARADEAPSTAELKKLSVEELLNIEVTSVSRSRESLAGAAAAVAIVTSVDIKSSGALSVPDALRYVPGLHIANTAADDWAVSSRGFSGVNSEKLLVLSDTRSIYTPLFSGVFWDVQDYLMEDIDRIEVIRGPGAALWGSNAVNGVININTKSAEETQGGYLEAGGGTEQRVTAAARYGGAVAGEGYYRVFGKYFDQKAALDPPGSSPDGRRLGHVGFRSDWKPGVADGFTVQGDAYEGTVGQLFPSVSVIGRPGPTGRLEVGVSGGNVLGRWSHTESADSDTQIRFYYDRTHRNDPAFNDDLDTLDWDFQQRLVPARGQELIWGLSYRGMNDRNTGKGLFALKPQSAWDNLYSGFVQDQFAFRDALHVTLGTKLEHNSFSGFEAQPSVRATWDLSSNRTVWGAVSRAVRVPTRLERDVNIYVTDPAGNPVELLAGNTRFHSEELVAFELGHRWQVVQNTSLDLAAFHNRYRGLASLELGTIHVDPTTGQIVIPIVNRNATDGRSDGAEALVTYAPLAYWKLSLTYSYIDMRLDPHGLDLNHGKLAEGSTPRNQVGLRSFLDLPANLQVDALLRALSAVRSQPDAPLGGEVPAYEELDLRVAWHGWRNTEVSVVGQNLLHDHHVEFGAPGMRSGLQRSVYGTITWRY